MVNLQRYPVIRLQDYIDEYKAWASQHEKVFKVRGDSDISRKYRDRDLLRGDYSISAKYRYSIDKFSTWH